METQGVVLLGTMPDVSNKCAGGPWSPISGVTRGAGAREKVSLLRPRRNLWIFSLRHKKIGSYPSTFLMTFLVITQFFLINYYNTRVLYPSLPNYPTKLLILRPLYKLYYKQLYFSALFKQYLPQFSVIIMERL